MGTTFQAQRSTSPLTSGRWLSDIIDSYRVTLFTWAGLSFHTEPRYLQPCGRDFMFTAQGKIDGRTRICLQIRVNFEVVK